jgi:hypothetical protein
MNEQQSGERQAVPARRGLPLLVVFAVSATALIVRALYLASTSGEWPSLVYAIASVVGAVLVWVQTRRRPSRPS